MNQAIYLELPEVESRLMELGLCVEEVHAAIRNGELHRNSCTKNDPPCLSGILTWGKTVRGLRDILAPKGWTSTDENNFSVALNPAGTVAIAVATGDISTGNPRLTPETKYPKGPATAAAIEQNRLQLAQPPLFIMEKPKAILPQDLFACTWLLLISRRGDEVFSELSLPRLITDKGHVVGWEERILLPAFPINGDSGPLTYKEEIAEDDIIVEVLRR